MIMLDRRETSSAFCPEANGVVCGSVSVKSGNGARPAPRRCAPFWSTCLKTGWYGGYVLGRKFSRSDYRTETPTYRQGSTFDGSYEPVAKIATALDRLQERTG
jgi:hypothetical protein